MLLPVGNVLGPLNPSLACEGRESEKSPSSSKQVDANLGIMYLLKRDVCSMGEPHHGCRCYPVPLASCMSLIAFVIAVAPSISRFGYGPLGCGFLPVVF